MYTFKKIVVLGRISTKKQLYLVGRLEKFKFYKKKGTSIDILICKKEEKQLAKKLKIGHL